MIDPETIAALLHIRGDLDVLRGKIDALVGHYLEPATAAANAQSPPLTLQQAAHATGHSEATLRRWAKDFGVGVKAGGRWAFDREIVVDFARSRQGL
ncbi:helix-turn-helix domain-containing protein [Methylocella sp.]|uniref:helix-turn-helix domain-containing protein n=1 Tax=Methylocella sp. TaxID=1978226 RepID=UPI003782F56A